MPQDVELERWLADEVDETEQFILTRQRPGRQSGRLLVGLGLFLGVALLTMRWRSSSEPASSLRGDVREAEELFTEPGACLCVFDIDRTLTTKQGWGEQCQGTLELKGKYDTAYGGGVLTFSDMQQNLLTTFCGSCFTGIVTAGQASGPDSEERKSILEALGGVHRTRSDYWQDIKFDPHANVSSSLVLQALDSSKQTAVLSMLDWFKRDQHVTIKNEDVFFFDDIADNVKSFEGTGLNAHQISCKSRDPGGRIGGCGGQVSQIVKTPGVGICEVTA
mmetsp:Transcript_77468/g.160993  ORF Transcript_77468/g.160993 Transcript_77468/m.160993 type:complete len:277 (+) Transcript_77468:76-906(+)